MNVGCAGKTVRSLENACLSTLEVRSRRGAIQIHVYLYLYYYLHVNFDLHCLHKEDTLHRDLQKQILRAVF